MLPERRWQYTLCSKKHPLCLLAQLSKTSTNLDENLMHVAERKLNLNV